MRISGGKRKGHRIEMPTVSDLRPSQERVREAIFNILGDISENLVLDIYAGTGALGIEALSRGARFCDFVDKSKDAARIIERNLLHADLRDFADVYAQDAASFVNKQHFQPYDLIFMDPPYAEHPRNVIRMLHKLMADTGLIIYLHSKRISLDETVDQKWAGEHLELRDSRKYGDTMVSFFAKRPPNHPAINPEEI